MKKHIQIYHDYFGYYPGEFIECEVCGRKAVDIHHIRARGNGGDPTGSKDKIENLMALCRTCHVEYGDKKQYMQMLINRHNDVLNGH